MIDTEVSIRLTEEEEQKWRAIHEMEFWKYHESCSYCGRRQYQIVKAPRQIEVEIWRWNTVCYACKRVTPVVWTIEESSGFTWDSIEPHSFERLPHAIEREYPFFKTVFKKTMNVEEHGNTCVHCGAYQGDWFVRDESLDMAYDPETADERKKILVELTEYEQLYYANPKQVFKMHRPRKGKYEVLCPDCFELYRNKKI